MAAVWACPPDVLLLEVEATPASARRVLTMKCESSCLLSGSEMTT